MQILTLDMVVLLKRRELAVGDWQGVRLRELGCRPMVLMAKAGWLKTGIANLDEATRLLARGSCKPESGLLRW